MNKLLFRILIIGFTLIFTGCSEDSDDPVSSGSDMIDTPTTYTFESRYVAGESSVSYSGQVVRNMLISAIKSHITDADVTAAKLNSLYMNDDAAAMYTDGTTMFHSVSTSRLENKISTESVIGYGVTPAELMATWFGVAESLAGDNVTADGVFVNQMVGKGLLGTVSYYQGTSVYLGDSKLDNDTNTQDCEDDGTCNNYSDMEHHWDESFGYFGAARNYSTMTDDQRQSSGSGDYKEAVNFDWAKYASKRSGVAGDYDDLIMNAYLEGRTLITNQASLAEIKAQRDIIVMNWEKVVAANVVHYANDVIGLIEGGGVDFDCSADSNCGKYWAEMAAFVLSLQYNSHSDMTDAELTELHNLVGQAPPVAGEGTDYVTSLNSVNSTIGNKLGWTADQLAAF